MEFSLSKEQVLIQNMAQEFAEQNIEPLVEQDRPGESGSAGDFGRLAGIGTAGPALPGRIWRCRCRLYQLRVGYGTVSPGINRSRHDHVGQLSGSGGH